MAIAPAVEGESVAVGTRGSLRAVDLLLLAYTAVTSVVAAARRGRFPECEWILVANGLMAVLIVLLARRDLGLFGRRIREIYPIFLLVGLYSALDVLNGGGRIAVHDAAVQRWEAALFGGQPSRDWWRAAPSQFWSTVLHAAYFSYYLIIAVPTLALLRLRRHLALERFVLAVMVTFAVCYLCFIFYPVAGPYYVFPRPTGDFVANPMARLVYTTLAAGSSFGAAFPSSHVAVSVAATLAAGAASRWLGIILAILTLLLTIGVVYCQMHYAIDALAGLGIGGVIGLVLVGRR